MLSPPVPPPAATPASFKHYTDRALDCLRTAKDRGWADVVSLEDDTDLEPIRNDPAFKELLDEFQRSREKRP